jgi:hypothetical protein
MSNTSPFGTAIPVLMLLVCACLSSCCKRDVQARHPSPSQRKVLSVVRVDCAGFDSFRTEVRLEDATGTGGQVVARINRSPVVQVTWVDDSSVLVFVPKGHDIHVEKKEIDGVRIDFR